MSVEASLKKMFGMLFLKRKSNSQFSETEKLDLILEKTKGYRGIESEKDLIKFIKKNLLLNSSIGFKNFYKFLNGTLDIEDQFDFNGNCSLNILTEQKEIKLNLHLREINFDNSSESIILNFEFVDYFNPPHPLESPYFDVYRNLFNDLKRANIPIKSFINQSFYKEREQYSPREQFYTKLTSLYKAFEINIFSPTKKYVVAYKMLGELTKSHNTICPKFNCKNFTILTDIELDNLLLEYTDYINKVNEDIQFEFKKISSGLIENLGLEKIENVFIDDEVDDSEEDKAF
jgi:hypothetical protein